MFIFSALKLREQREDKGLSREQLGLGAGLSASTITVLENGYRSPSRAALIRMAGALGCSPRDLCDEDPAFAQAVAR